MLTVGSLFSGIGGLELGLERTGGFKTAWQCEIDPFCLKVLAKHWPEVKRFTDVKKMGLEEDIPYVDVICGGFPCQDISCAGKGAGIHAERSGLWWEAIRIIRMVRPRFVIVENVAALLNRGLDEVLGSLAESGYDAEWQVLSAAMFGAPHLRRRCFILAYPNCLRFDSGGAEQPLSGNWADGKEGVASHTDCWNGDGWAEPGNGGPDRAILHGTKGTIANTTRVLLQRFNDRPRQVEPWGSDWRQAPPAICGMDDGIPGRVDRLRSLGNAVVPQVSEYVGRCILEAL